MNQSGRFDFWRMLLCTRAITPPDVAVGLLHRVAHLSVPSWVVLFVIATLGVGAALYFSNARSRSDPAVASQMPKAVAVAPAPKPSQPW